MYVQYSIYSLQYFGKYIDYYVAKNYGVKVMQIAFEQNVQTIDYNINIIHVAMYTTYAQVLDLKYVTFSKHMQKSSNYA